MQKRKSTTYFKLPLPKVDSEFADFTKTVQKVSFSRDEAFALVLLLAKEQEETLAHFWYLVNLSAKRVAFVQSKRSFEVLVFSKTHDARVFRFIVEKKQLKVQMLQIDRELNLRLLKEVFRHGFRHNLRMAKKTLPYESEFLIYPHKQHMSEFWNRFKQVTLVAVRERAEGPRVYACSFGLREKPKMQHFALLQNDVFYINNLKYSFFNCKKLNWLKNKCATTTIAKVLSPRLLNTDKFVVYFGKSKSMKLVNIFTGKHADCARTGVSGYSEVNKALRERLYIAERDQVHRFDLARGKPQPQSRICLANFGDRMGHVSARLFDQKILRVGQAEPIELVFDAHRQKHDQKVLQAVDSSPDFEVRLTWNEIEGIQLVSRLLDPKSDTLVMLLRIYNKIYNDTYYDLGREEEIVLSLSVTSRGREFKSELTMHRHFDVEDYNANCEKYVLISYGLQTGEARFQILEPILQIDELLSMDGSWIHFSTQLDKRKLNRIKYKSNKIYVNDALELGEICYEAKLAAVFSIANNLEVLGASEKFHMINDYYCVGKGFAAVIASE